MVNKLILGTVQFGMPYGINNSHGKPAQNDVFAMLDYAYPLGIDTLDTANAYGSAMEVLGNYHAASANRFRIIGKFHLPDVDHTLAIDKDLEQLGVDGFEAYLFHSFGDYEACSDKVFDQLKQLKAAGKIRKLGVSIYTNEQFIKAANDSRIDLIQFPFNLLDNTTQRSIPMELAKKHGKELHTRSVFLQGLFFARHDAVPEKLKPLLPHLKTIHKLCSAYGLSTQQLALAYVLSNPFIDKVLIGVETFEQLSLNIEASYLPVSADCIAAVNMIHVKEAELLNPVNWK